MTLRELKQALAELPQLPDSTELTVENDGGDLQDITYLEWEREYQVVVIHLGTVVDK